MFAELNPVKRVPVKGSWICWFFMSLVGFFLDLESIAKVISCGNLLTYSFVTACGVALRFRDRETQTTERVTAERWVWAFLVASFNTALCLMKEAPIWVTVSFGVISFIILVRLCFVP